MYCFKTEARYLPQIQTLVNEPCPLHSVDFFRLSWVISCSLSLEFSFNALPLQWVRQWRHQRLSQWKAALKTHFLSKRQFGRMCSQFGLRGFLGECVPSSGSKRIKSLVKIGILTLNVFWCHNRRHPERGPLIDLTCVHLKHVSHFAQTVLSWMFPVVTEISVQKCVLGFPC